MMLSRFSCLTFLAISGLLLSSCATAPSSARVHDPAQPIWKPMSSPRVLSRVTLVNGGPDTLDIDGCVSGDIAHIEVLGVDGADGIRVAAKKEKPSLLEISSVPDLEQQGVVNLRVKTTDGKVHTVGFPVSNKSQPSKRITFKPEDGVTVKSVSIAGKFNGWSASANPLLDDDGDGVWEADVPMEPGTWPYKFVVDGNWILDPANPEILEDGGHQNSALVLKGEKSGALMPLSISMLPAQVPGVGNQGGFKVELEDGARLEPAGVQVFVNNVPLRSEEYRIDPGSGVISLNVSSVNWGTQQFVSVTATDTAGRSGSCVAPFDFASSPRTPKDEVIYYVVLDRFKNGDPSNDDPVDDPDVHPLNDYMGGDIAGVRQMIDSGYFDDLGVTTLWISPPYDQPDVAYADSKPPHRKLTGYHGYWPTDMRNVEPRWGTVEEFRGMVEDAHRHDMAVIIDFVSNHLHESNPMVTSHPDWFSTLELPDGTKNIRQYDAHPFTTWFDEFLPDIAFDQSAEATEYMTDTAVWWIEKTGADGFRHDAVKHVPNVFWEMCTRKLNEQISKPQNKRLYQVGETVSSRTTINNFIGPRLLDGQFDFPLFWTIEDAFGWERSDMNAVAKSLQATVDEYPTDAIMSPFLGNHDVPRFMGKAEYDNKPGDKRISEEEGFTNPAHVDDVLSYDKLKLAFSFLLTVPGAPMVYYGDEIGMTGSGRPDARRMFLLEDEWNKYNKSTYKTVKALLHARQESVALRRGAYQLLSVDSEHLVYARIAPEEVALVAIQRHPETDGTLRVPLPAAWGQPAVFEPLALDGLSKSDVKFNADGTLEVATKPYTAGVWRLKWR